MAASCSRAFSCPRAGFPVPAVRFLHSRGAAGARCPPPRRPSPPPAGLAVLRGVPFPTRAAAPGTGPKPASGAGPGLRAAPCHGQDPRREGPAPSRSPLGAGRGRGPGTGRPPPAGFRLAAARGAKCRRLRARAVSVPGDGGRPRPLPWRDSRPPHTGPRTPAPNPPGPLSPATPARSRFGVRERPHPPGSGGRRPETGREPRPPPRLGRIFPRLWLAVQGEASFVCTRCARAGVRTRAGQGCVCVCVHTCARGQGVTKHPRGCPRVGFLRNQEGREEERPRQVGQDFPAEAVPQRGAAVSPLPQGSQ